MKMKLRNLLLLLIFTNLHHFIFGMNEVVNFSQETADEQLFNIIENTIPEIEPPAHCYSVDSEGTQRIPDCWYMVRYNTKFCFDARPIEKAVIKHKKRKLLGNPTKQTWSGEVIQSNESNPPPIESQDLIKNYTSSIKPQLKLVDKNIRRYTINYLLDPSMRENNKNSLELVLLWSDDGWAYFNDFLIHTISPAESSRKVRDRAMDYVRLMRIEGKDTSDALSKLVNDGHKFQEPHYLEAVGLLLSWGANPNKLFYRYNEKKLCYLNRYDIDTKLLIQVLSHPRREIDPDEPDDFEYLQNPYTTSIMSIFNNHRKTGQENLYKYAIDVYKLAFDIHKTFKSTGKMDMQKLRQHIINRHERTLFGFVCFSESLNRNTANPFLQKLYGLFSLFRPSNMWQNIYNLPSIVLGKICSLKNILPKPKTLFGRYQIFKPENN